MYQIDAMERRADRCVKAHELVMKECPWCELTRLRKAISDIQEYVHEKTMPIKIGVDLLEIIRKAK
jgi:hypothetical protein